MPPRSIAACSPVGLANGWRPPHRRVSLTLDWAACSTLLPPADRRCDLPGRREFVRRPTANDSAAVVRLSRSPRGRRRVPRVSPLVTVSHVEVQRHLHRTGSLELWRIPEPLRNRLPGRTTACRVSETHFRLLGTAPSYEDDPMPSGSVTSGRVQPTQTLIPRPLPWSPLQW
jgi:hypothetical protein